MQANRRAQVASGAVVTANGVIGQPFSNLGQSSNPTCVLLVNVTAISSGASVEIDLMASLDGVTFVKIGSITGVNAVGLWRAAIHDVLEPTLQVQASNIAGTSPSITMNVDVLMTSPDS
jgi:hypothetical protein